MTSVLVLFSYIVLFSSGVLGLAGVLVWMLRKRDPFVRPLFVFTLFWTLGILAMTFHFFFFAFTPVLGVPGVSDFFAGMFIVTGVSAAFFLRILHRLLSKNRTILEILVGVVLAATPWLPLLIPDFYARNLAQQYSVASLLIGIVLTLGYSCVLLVKQKLPNQLDEELRQFLLIFLAILALTAVVDVILEYSPLHPLMLEHLTFCLWNVYILTHTVKRLRNTVSSEVAGDWNDAYKLSPRETQTVEGILKGWSNKKIALEMGIEESTVKTYVSSIFQKCHVPSRFELIHLLRK